MSDAEVALSDNQRIQTRTGNDEASGSKKLTKKILPRCLLRIINYKKQTDYLWILHQEFTNFHQIEELMINNLNNSQIVSY